jgi:hypothetical protein
MIVKVTIILRVAYCPIELLKVQERDATMFIVAMWIGT